MEDENVVSKGYSLGFKFNGWVNNEDINKDEEYTEVPKQVRRECNLQR